MENTVLRSFLLFSAMTNGEIESSLHALKAHEKTYEKDALILHAGSRTKKMGLVLSGSVLIESVDLWGNRSVLSLVQQGDFFAETYAMVPSEPLLVDVRANEKTRVLFMDPSILQKAEDPAPSWKEKLILRLLQISMQKNLALSARSIHTAPKSARARILSYLSSVARRTGSRIFDIPFDRQQLADYLNLERTNMSKELSRMQKEGILIFRKNHFELTGSPEELFI